MGGYIRKREILAHPLQIIRGFGFRVFFASLFATRETTFLSILTQHNRI